jgi:hypothetical protein
LILAILFEEREGNRKCCWTHLYDKLVEQEENKTRISPYYLNNCLAKLEKENLTSRNDDGKRGKRIELFITDLGLQFYKNKIDFDDLTMYQKSRFLLASMIGTGVTYDGSKVSRKSISKIQSRNNYNSISLSEIKKGYVSKRNRLFGYIDYYREIDENNELQNDLDFLVTKGILTVDSNGTDMIYSMGDRRLAHFFSLCQHLLYHVLSFLKFIFSYVRRSSDNERDMLTGLFGQKFYNKMEIGCDAERIRVKNIIKEDTRKIGKTKDLESLLKDQLIKLNKLFKWVLQHSKQIQDQYFIVSMMLHLIIPEFLREKEKFIKSLKISSTRKYVWFPYTLSHIMIEDQESKF